jgi:hypothetical protein
LQRKRAEQYCSGKQNRFHDADKLADALPFATAGKIFCTPLANLLHKRFPIHVQELEPSDIHHLNAALGWLGLNAPADARAELDAIAPAQQSHPAVLEARWLICAHENNWREGLAVAERELAAAPDDSSGWLHHAYALRRVPDGGLEPAWNALLPAAEKFPEESVIPYNLACYACQRGQLDTARGWLKRAIKTGGKNEVQKMALADDDLKPLWDEIKEL